MAKRNLLSRSLPRVELDHRARDARVRLVRIERLFVPCAAVASFWLSRLVRLLGFRIFGNGRRGDRTAESLSNPRGSCMPETDSACFEGCDAFCRE